MNGPGLTRRITAQQYFSVGATSGFLTSGQRVMDLWWAKTWGCGTSSRACSYTSHADLWPHKRPKPQEQLPGDSQPALLLLSPGTSLARPPPSPLYGKTPGAAEAADVETHWSMLLTLCNQSALIVFFFFSLLLVCSSLCRFWGPVWRWWYSVTNAAAGIMDDHPTSPHLNVFIFSPPPL